MPRKPMYYGVARGRKIGVFSSWKETEKQVKKFSGAKYQKFPCEKEALEYIARSKKLSNIEKFVLNSENYVIAYTDGACPDNGFNAQHASYGIHFPNKEHEDLAGLAPKPPTNQRGELTAIYKLLEVYDSLVTKKDLAIYTDSKYSIGCLTEWSKRWVNNGWLTSKGVPVENRDIIEPTLELLKKYPNTVFKHVKGHSGNPGNTKADKLARDFLKKLAGV